ncbi:MAG TPA: NAD(P)/FAD-dependent oxidoreductase [Bacteroidia bacterium]|nr:NAD(P)/FAD-dependent oxidoreductase [Bacteroidia bacterium]HRH07837.1 NAD(P)/FAD-dependent oxidoreductase [Bacteroidia bacterium]
MNKQTTIVVIGAGAAGYFAAINAAQNFQDKRVILLEKSNKVLSKVKVSGGGRCNVTHACFDIQQFAKNYPRGAKQLLQAFHQFSASDTVQWFKQKGIELKAEADGRMFPQSNTSQSIIDCFTQAASLAKVQLRLQTRISSILHKDHVFEITFDTNEKIIAHKLILASGGINNLRDHDWLVKLGHTLIPPLPSLFTFNTPNSPITQLMGVSVPSANISIKGSKLSQQGPILITHWGFSGPAVLKLSAWGAKELAEKNYEFDFSINWMPRFHNDAMVQEIQLIKNRQAKQQLGTRPWPEFPKRLWEFLLEKANIDAQSKWADLSKKQGNKLAELLCNDTYQAKGKTTFKEEFVTCGGVSLNDIDFNTMQSKMCPNLYFAGEILDVDGVTGGFNFQAAWTTAWIAAKHLY